MDFLRYDWTLYLFEGKPNKNELIHLMADILFMSRKWCI